MKSSSLLGLALELCASVATSGPYPADARIGRFFRARRFLGSRDRRRLASTAYGWLRHGHRARARWESWHEALGTRPAPDAGEVARLRELVALARDGLVPWSLAELLDAERTRSPDSGLGRDPLLDRLLEDPARAEALLDERCWPREPAARAAAELSLPPWLAERLIAERGREAGSRLARSLLEPAPVDLRVNLARADRETVRSDLERELGERVVPTTWSPLGLRLATRLPLKGTRAWKEGWIDVEDEGSQLVALSLDASPGATVIDACAGAGGKALALADLLGASRIIALDVDPERLARLAERARRASAAESIRAVPLSPPGEPPSDLPEADLVLIDAPCSGLGTLRRSPDLKWRHGPEDVRRFHDLQRSLLERWRRLVRPGGRLAYVTCSLLREENEAVAARFAADHPELEAYASAWAGRHLPQECRAGGFLRLDPDVTGTDGLFVAMWTRL